MPKNKRKRENVPQDSEENTGFTKLGVFDAKDKAKVRRVLPKWLAQPDIVSLDLGDQQMPIEGQAHDMFSRIFRLRIYEFLSSPSACWTSGASKNQD